MSAAARSVFRSRVWPLPRRQLPELTDPLLLFFFHFGGPKCLPGLPGAFPVFLGRPAFRFKITEVVRRIGFFGKMPHRLKRIVDLTVLSLLAIKSVPHSVIFGRRTETFF